MKENISVLTNNATINLALDTIKKEKQALIFVNSKRSAEKVAEEIAKNRNVNDKDLMTLKEKALKTLSGPTRQCHRLAKCMEKGISFHHAGLHHKQKELIEESFKKGLIKIISSTSTLAAGVDLPAFRTIIRDVKRYSSFRGMDFIPVLEYLQMAGRAGRPSYDKHGEAIVIIKNEEVKEEIIEKYLKGEPEEITSKLAVEPVLRRHVLSLITTGITKTEEELKEFFTKTFWAHQYQDYEQLNEKIDTVSKLLILWGLIEKETLKATRIGRRVAELYIDPLTAHEFINGLHKTSNTRTETIIQCVSNTIEMRPLIRFKQKEYDELAEWSAEYEPYLLAKEPSMFDPMYEEWLKSIKTTQILLDWMNEKNEEIILEKHNVRPGELHAKKETADWLLYALKEIAKYSGKTSLIKDINNVRIRLKYGVKEELLPLVRLKYIGRVKARQLYQSGVKNLSDLSKTRKDLLEHILGKKTAKKVLEQLK